MTDHTVLNVGDQHGDDEERRGTAGQDPVTFDCEYCEVVLRTRTVEAMKDRGTAHLESHKATLSDVFADKRRGKHCQNECSYVFPVGVDRTTGFECPKCGYDNFEAFALRYLYWQIEYPKNPLPDPDRE